MKRGYNARVFLYVPRITMPKKPIINRTCLASMIAISANSHATEMRIAGEMMHFDYEETDINGNTLNQETGIIPGITVSASTTYRSIDNTLEFSIYDGQVDYDGRTQAGQPHQTTTEETIYRLLYRLSWSPQSTIGAFYGKAYWQQWDRDIQPFNGVQGLFERYQWWSVEAGVQVPFIKSYSHDLLLELGMLATFDGNILIDLESSGFGSPVLELGNGVGFSGELKYEHKQSDNSSFLFGVQLKTWEFDRSNSKTVSNGSNIISITEPDSTTIQTTLSASYIHRF